MEAQSTDSTELYIQVVGWLHENRKKLIVIGSIVVVVAAVFGLMSWQKATTEADANAKLMSVPLQAIHPGQQLPTPTPAGAFMDVAKQYPDSPSGENAALLGAESYFLEGKYQDAHQAFAKFIDENPTSALIPQAKVGLAASLEGEGKLSEAAQKYQELVLAYPTDANIASPAKLTLARLDEQLNKPEQALNYYQELARINNPYDPWAAEARERGEALLLKRPELRAKLTPPPTAKQPGSTISIPPLKTNPSPTAAPVTKPKP